MNILQRQSWNGCWRGSPGDHDIDETGFGEREREMVEEE